VKAGGKKMPDSFWSLQRQIEEYLRDPKMEAKSKATRRSAKKSLMRGARGLRDAGLELNPEKMGKKEMYFLRDSVYGGELYNKHWNMAFWRGFMHYMKNRVFDEVEFKIPKCTRKSVRWLSQEEDEVVWGYIMTDATPIQQIVLTLESGLGLRRIELLRLTIHDMKNNSLHVLGKGRNGGKPRVLPLDKVSRQAINHWLQERSRIIAEAKKKHPSIEVPDTLLIHLHGKRLKEYGETGIDAVVKGAAKEISELLGRPFEMSNHDLRRTMGRRQWKNDTPIETISELLGHNNPIMTKQYIGVDQDDMKAAVESCMDNMMARINARKEAARAS
jgi:integrase